MDKQKLLKENKAFCVLPWIHMHVWPNGNVMPCCISDSDDVYGNVKNNTIKEVWNSDKYKTLRKAMLAGEKLSSCNRCYELENSTNIWTLRKNHNKWFGEKHFDIIESTNKDGSIDNPRMAYLDIRFSNLCNMKCRTCGPELSSNHAIEFEQLYGKHELARMLDNDGSPVINIAQKNNFWEDINRYLLDVEEVYWAGGEALITNEHYQILDKWIESGKTNVRLRYTTNFSNLKFKKKSIIDYWKHFDDVQVSASLDSKGTRAEYARNGTKWEQIEKNRVWMLEQVPHVHFELTPTLSLYNAWAWPDFHMDWVERGLVDVENCRFNILTQPKFMRVDIIPEHVKQDLRAKYIDYKQWSYDKIKHRIDSKPELLFDVLGKIDSFIRFLNKGQLDKSLLKELFEYDHKLDQHRHEDYWAVYPEMEWLRSYV